MPERPEFTQLELTTVDFLRDVYGAKPSGATRWDETGEYYIDFAFFWGTADRKTEVVSTVGLAAHSEFQEEGEIDRAVELTGVNKTSDKWLSSVLEECAFRVMRDGDLIKMGTVCRNLETLDSRSTTLGHVLFVAPFLMPGDFGYGLALENDVTIKWLQAIPISDAEDEFVRENGYLDLMRIIDGEMADIRDVNRAPVL